jgi:hypothetical protein
MSAEEVQRATIAALKANSRVWVAYNRGKADPADQAEEIRWFLQPAPASQSLDGSSADLSPATTDSSRPDSPNSGPNNSVGESGSRAATTPMPAGRESTSANNRVDRHAVESGIPEPATITTTRAAEDETEAPGTLAITDA